MSSIPLTAQNLPSCLVWSCVQDGVSIHCYHRLWMITERITATNTYRILMYAVLQSHSVLNDPFWLPAVEVYYLAAGVLFQALELFIPSPRISCSKWLKPSSVIALPLSQLCPDFAFSQTHFYLKLHSYKVMQQNTTAFLKFTAFDFHQMFLYSSFCTKKSLTTVLITSPLAVNLLFSAHTLIPVRLITARGEQQRIHQKKLSPTEVPHCHCRITNKEETKHFNGLFTFDSVRWILAIGSFPRSH